MAEGPTKGPTRVEINRYHSLPQPLKIVCLVLWVIGLGLAIFYMFAWDIKGWILGNEMFYFLFYACFSTTVFLTMSGRKKDKNRLPWYDLVLAATVFGIMVYWFLHSYQIAMIGWVPAPHMLALVLASIIIPIAIEGGRRLAGWALVILVALFGLYPLVSEYMPGILYGPGLSWDLLAPLYAYGKNGLLGLPAQIMGDILVGFMIFAGMLLSTGAGRFFLNLAIALMGRFRGGPAKVAVVASGFFGSLSGAPMANIITTGSFTIPAMKRMGYPPYYAGAIEAVASTGGTIMPPVMGAIAFIMAIIADIPYAAIVAGAFIPAILYYWGLIVQVDAYAARAGLKGLSREEMPSLLKTLKEGWQYLLVIAFLCFGLLYMRWGPRAPIYASLLLFVLSFTSKETMMTPKRLVAVLETIGNLITYMISILVPIGLVLVGLGATGTLTALTIPIVQLGGTNIFVVLIIAVVVCYLFGMIGVTGVPYIVLAVCVIPALVEATGLSKLGFHLFIMYYLLMAGITPPICISAFIAAALAGAPPFKTGFTAMRLAIVLYFIPFFYLFNPALILEGPILETLYLFALCLVGIWILASGLEGYLLKVGRLSLWSRPLFVVGGFLIAFPDWMVTIFGAALTAMAIVLVFIVRRTGVRFGRFSA